MEPRVLKRKSFQIVGYALCANLKEIEEQNLGKQTLARLEDSFSEIHNKVGNNIYLVQIYPMKDNFNAMEDAFTQIIGYEVSEAVGIPEFATHHIIPENFYVTYTHQGPEAELYKTYDYLYRDWLGANNFQPIGYDAELWDKRYKPESIENEIDVFIAVKEKE
ncbi:MAG: GyrI-like domain-containing protein [Psychrobacillus sp.]